MNKKGFSIWGFLIAMIIFLAIGWFITNNLYVTYNSINLDKKDYICDNDIIKLIPNELNEYGFEFRYNPEDECYYQCLISDNYRNIYKKKNFISCELNNPICECKASIYSYYIYDLFKRR